MRAAAYQFARRPYDMVNLDDVLADAQVTKGALYFHFRSKYALAAELVEQRTEDGRAGIAELVARGLSALETLIDVSYFVAVADISNDLARAALNLLQAIGRTDGLQTRVFDGCVIVYTLIAQKAIEEGDVVAGTDPAALGRLLLSVYLGLRQSIDPSNPARFLSEMEKLWILVLPGFANPDRLDYLVEFTKRRSALAIKKAETDLNDL
jgi:AcrR family transcriptional regulator